jgi:omega-hydroxy-beta-dihydromenaquinone-9 sulfotransferase
MQIYSLMTASAATPSPLAVDLRKIHRYPWWSPRFWSGMRLREWIRMLIENRSSIPVSKLPWLALNTFRCPSNGALGYLQNSFIGNDIRRTAIRQPIFVIGHWRSGTTLLHELLVQDPKFGAPCNYHVFAPHHFLITEWIAKHFFPGMLPEKRPMDDVRLDWNTPQEDEFFHLAMGRGTPYLRLAFPHKPWTGIDYADMEGLDERELDAWKAVQLWFMQAVAYGCKKQLVMKSPAHTGRIHVLMEMFPDAKFVHITREPYGMFASTVRMWRALDASQSIQDPHGAPVEDYVLTLGKRIYRSFQRHRYCIPENRICEIRYDDLVANPMDSLENVYSQLRLGDFENVRSKGEAFLAERKHFQTNHHSIPEVWRRRVDREWGEYIAAYGYQETTAARKRA